MSDEAKKAIALMTVLFLTNRPHSLICSCSACKVWDDLDKLVQPKVLSELDEISGRKPNPMKKI